MENKLLTTLSEIHVTTPCAPPAAEAPILAPLLNQDTAQSILLRL